jgi:hypothetical protein
MIWLVYLASDPLANVVLGIAVHFDYLTFILLALVLRPSRQRFPAYRYMSLA